jgi:uncharacterized iron-regulated membrane protein
VRPIVWFRGGLRGKARDFNWHNAIGVWCCIPLALVVVGAMPISFPWANQAVYQLVGEQPPAPATPGSQAAPRGGVQARGERVGRGVETRADVALEPLWQRAERQVEGWRTIAARFGGSGPVAFTIDRGTGGQPQLRGTLTLDRATAAVVRWDAFDQQTTGRRLRTFLRFAHTGEYFGVAGQTVAGIASAGGVVLVWTGISLALRRLRGWRVRRQIRVESPTIERSTAA